MSNKIILYNTEDGESKIELHVDNGTVWLSQLELAELFQTSKQNISKHINAILKDRELEEKVVVNYQLTTTIHGAMPGKTQTKKVAYYSLDMILAVGYRVRSARGIQFRIYASTILKDYLIKGFAMDDKKLKNLGGGGYFKELLDRIRDIRSSEKVFYRQVLDLFATYERVNSEKEFMGLTVFRGELPTLEEAKIAKNYLSEKELKGLNTLVSGLLDFAERQAQKEVTMTMNDWLKYVDKMLRATGEKILIGNGSISKEQADKRAQVEYKKYRQNTLSQVERDYLNGIKSIEQKAKENNKNKQDR